MADSQITVLNPGVTLSPDWDEEHPWVRQPCDDEKSWIAFVSYRDGSKPRTLLDVAQATGEPIGRIRRWSRENAWDDRVFFFDRWVDVRRSEQVMSIIGEDAAERALRHINLLRGMQEVVAATVTDWLRQVRAGQLAFDNPKDVIRAIKEMITLERLIAGETTGAIEVKGGYDLAKLSVADLERLLEIQDKAQG